LHRRSPLLVGSFVYVVILCGLEIVVALVLAGILLDFAIAGSMREAMRFTVIDAPWQFAFIAPSLALASLALRYGAEANIELVLPEMFDGPGNIGAFARLLPRALALIVGIAVGAPLIELGIDQLTGSAQVLGSAGAGYVSLAFGAVAVVIGVLAALARSLHARNGGFDVGHSGLVLRLALSLVPLIAIAALLGTVLGLFPGATPDRYLGIAQGAVERYSGADSFYHIAIEAGALFLTAVAVRTGISIVLDLLLPETFGHGRFELRELIPRVAAAAVGFAAAIQLNQNYANAKLTGAQSEWFYAIAFGYIAVAILASLIGWRRSDSAPSIGERWRIAADRIEALPKGWCRAFMLAPLGGAAIFLFFADTTQISHAQLVGPIAVMLLWGFSAIALFAPVAYLSQMTKMPLLLMLLAAGVAFAGFDLNDNHQIRGASTWRSARHHTEDQGYYREQLDLGEWLKSRRDWRAYEHYPIFLVATEGGGIRAAYFTASVLDALEQKCPGFAQHVIAISSVSGGSVGSAVFAGQSADATVNTDIPGCTAAPMTPGAQLQKARDVLSTDLLSPLLGATLFPDALQRILPMPVRSFDRARALEYALEDGWRRASAGCKGCDPERMTEPVASLYVRGDPRKPVPHLFLNITEAGTGINRPFATWDIGDLAVPERSVSAVERDALPRPILVPVQDRMRRDDVPLSTAAMLSARFPYLTPAGKLGNTGHYVDGGYFENSGTWLLSGVAQNLIGQRLDYTDPNGDKELEEAVQNAIITVIVIRSEPCTRQTDDGDCDEDKSKGDPDSTLNEMLSPLRALLATRDKRAEYSVTDLGAVTALIQRLTGAATVTQSAAETSPNGMQCNELLCAVTMRFMNAPGAEVPLTWMLSSRARISMDNATNRILEENLDAPPHPIDAGDRIEGSYRQVLCLLKQGKDMPACPAAAQ
jgi:predicted acylesterase/phospholipase RssA